MNYTEKQFLQWCTWLFLQDVKGFGPARIKQLHNIAGSLENIFQYVHDNRLSFNWIRPLLDEYHRFDPEKYRPIIDLTFEHQSKICTLDDDIYPSNLRRSTTSPGILFYKGNIEKISERSLALVGTVDPSPEGIRRADRFARECIDHDIQVISGLARGIDTASHKTALRYGGITFAVVGHGIDYCYPSENKELFEEISANGAVISQFPTGTKPNPWMFPARNETMCTLSSGTVIIEGHAKCGSLIQAQHSFKHQRRVFILNSNLTERPDWAIKLVDQGARVVNDFEVVVKEMGEVRREFMSPGLIEEQSIFDINEKKAILLDLDNVLYDSFDLMEKIYIDVARQLKGTITDRDLITIKAKINQAPTYVFKCIGIDGSNGNRLYKDKYLSHIAQGITFFPQIDELINELSKKGYSMGIVTSQPHNRYQAIINQAPFAKLIETAITYNDLAKGEQKPHPAGLLKALERLNIKPVNAAYVGDDPKDIEAAKRAGMHSIAALWGAGDKEALLKTEPDFVANKPLDIIKFTI